MSQRKLCVLAASSIITLAASTAAFADGKCMDHHKCKGQNKCKTAEHECKTHDSSCKGDDQLITPTTEAACKTAGGKWTK